MVLTLKKWQQNGHAETSLRKEEDYFIHGYDAFVDYVQWEGRELCGRHKSKFGTAGGSAYRLPTEKLCATGGETSGPL